MPKPHDTNICMAWVSGAETLVILELIMHCMKLNAWVVTIYYLWALKGQWANTIPPQIMICPNVHLAQFFVSMTYCVHYIIMCLIFHHLVFLSTLLTFISKSYKPVTKHLSNVLIVKSEYVFLLSETHTFYLVAIFHRTLIWRTT